MRMLLVLLFAALPALAQGPESIIVLERREIALQAAPGSPRHELRLTLVYLDGSGWTPDTITGAAKESAQILGQCGLVLKTAELVRVAAPSRFHDFQTRNSRELAATLQLTKPTVYFVAGTRDLGIAMSHELAHVLLDSGKHSAEPNNLMRDETAPANTQLSLAQCARLRETGTANGLLSPR